MFDGTMYQSISKSGENYRRVTAFSQITQRYFQSNLRGIKFSTNYDKRYKGYHITAADEEANCSKNPVSLWF